ncbi:hypothetical protein B0H13DRAFT_2053329 [Mycena leptocephala]|nr:hypothetical protein B0H13DRAFT_2053329 [Mycena leptocephala]
MWLPDLQNPPIYISALKSHTSVQTLLVRFNQESRTMELQVYATRFASFVNVKPLLNMLRCLRCLGLCALDSTVLLAILSVFFPMPWSPSMRRQDLIFDAPTLALLADIGVALRCVLSTNTSQMAPMHADHQSINAKFFEARK